MIEFIAEDKIMGEKDNYLEQLTKDIVELRETAVDGKLTIEQLGNVKTWVPVDLIPDNLLDSYYEYFFGKTIGVINNVSYAYGYDVVRWIDSIK